MPHDDVPGPQGPLGALAARLPAHAGDLRRNLTSIPDDSRLSPQQLWGTLLVTAIASRSAVVLREIGREARARLTPEAYTAARSVAATTAVDNVFFRTRHLLSDPAYGTLRTGLRKDVLGARRPAGVGRADLELWSLAVSAVNACGACLDAHEQTLRAAGVERETVQDAFRIAAVVTALAVTLEAEAVLGGWASAGSGRREPTAPRRPG